MKLESGDRCSNCGRDDAWTVEYHDGVLLARCDSADEILEYDEACDTLEVEHATSR